MAIPSVNWVTGLIYVPKDYMVQIAPPPREVRRLDLDTFRLKLRDLEDDPDGRPWPQTHRHDTETTMGGVTYARKIEILAPYTVTFQDGQYIVDLYGANSNVQDVTNLNQVSVRSANSAGLVQVGGGELTKADVDAAVWVESAQGAQVVVDAAMARKSRTNDDLLSDDPDAGYVLLDDDGLTPIVTQRLLDKHGNPVPIPEGVPARRQRVL